MGGSIVGRPFLLEDEMDVPNVEGDTGLDPTIDLPKIDRRSREYRAMQAMKEVEEGRQPAIPAANPNDPISVLVAALTGALQNANAPKKPEEKLRWPDDKSEVRLRANRPVHVDCAHMAMSQISGSAYGMDGPSRKFKKDDLMVVRPGPWIDSLIEDGAARMAKDA